MKRGYDLSDVGNPLRKSLLQNRSNTNMVRYIVDVILRDLGRHRTANLEGGGTRNTYTFPQSYVRVQW